MDELSKEKRSWNMSRVKSKDTKIEVQVRKYIFSKGFRYRKNDKRFPGKPDIVLPKYKTVIFVNGCFWHRHPDCRYAHLPKSNLDYWEKKLERNAKNDALHIQQIESAGWEAVTLWECRLKQDFEGTMAEVIKSLQEKENNP